MVILAGGMGTRMKEYSQDAPKSMILISGKPFLQYQIELLREKGIRRILLCIGHLGDQVKAYFGSGEKFDVNIHYSEEGEKLLGTGGALKKAEPFLDDNFFLMWGDSYLLLDYQDIWKTFFKTRCDGLMVIYKNNNQRVKSNVVAKSGKVVLYDKWHSHPGMSYIDNGLSVFNKILLDEIPPQTVFLVEKVFEKWSKEGKLAAYETGQRFYEIGSPSGLKEFEAFVSSQKSKRSQQ